MFTNTKGRAWLKHAIEEMGALENFLPQLYAREVGRESSPKQAPGRYNESSLWAEKALQRRPNLLVAIRESAASNALAGRLLEAQKAMAQPRQFDPELRISNFTDWLPLRRPP